MRWLVGIMLLASACSSGQPSSQPSNDEVARLGGIVTNVDLISQTIALGAKRGEKPMKEVVKYNSLTVVDGIHGSARVEDLEFGDEVIVHGRRDKTSGEITAERIIMITVAHGRQ